MSTSRRIGILVTVGMSLLDNMFRELAEKKIVREAAAKSKKDTFWNDLRTALCEPDNIKLLDTDEKFKKEIAELIKRRKSQSSINMRSCAELQTFEGLIKNYLINEKKDSKITVVLLPTKETKDIAETIIKSKIKEYLRSKDWHLEKIEVYKFDGGVQQAEEYIKSIEDVARKLQVFLNQNFSKKYVILSGGYKGFIPIISILSMMYENTYLVYMHEKSSSPLIIPPMPLTPNFAELDSIRTILLRHRINNEVFDSLKEHLPYIELFYKMDNMDRVKGAIGTFFEEFYKNKRHIYGRGEYLLKSIDAKYRNGIMEKLPYWEHLWIGDQIPETVEHSRGHAKRLLEYATHILVFFPELRKALGDRGVYILYTSIWLHDFGHSILFVEKERYKTSGLILSLNKILTSNAKDKIIGVEEFSPVAVDPDLVRRYHNVYSVIMLQTRYKFLLPEVVSESGELNKAVLLAILYHRKKMPITNSKRQKDSEGLALEEVLRREIKDEALRYQTLLAAALLAFIDGLDVQIERVINKEYEKVRRVRDRYEIDFHLQLFEKETRQFLREDKIINAITAAKGKIDELIQLWEKGKYKEELENEVHAAIEKFKSQIPESIYYHLSRVLFIMRQKSHYKKHSLVSMVYLSKKKVGKENVLIVNIVKSDIVPSINDEIETLKSEIRDEIKIEFELREEVLKNYINRLSVEFID